MSASNPHQIQVNLMISEKRDYCLVISRNAEFISNVTQNLRPDYRPLTGKNWEECYNILRTQNVACTIFSCLSQQSFASQKNGLSGLKKSFVAIPFVGIVENGDLNLVMQCGKIGVDQVISRTQWHQLPNLITDLKMQLPVKLSVRKASAQSDVLIEQALQFIQNNYVSLMGTREVADHFGVAESILSRGFKKNFKVGPKRLLMYHKIIHAVNLMYNKGLCIKEVAHLSGFSNERRFNECFHKIFGCAPTVGREKINHIGAKVFISGLVEEINLNVC